MDTETLILELIVPFVETFSEAEIGMIETVFGYDVRYGEELRELTSNQTISPRFVWKLHEFFRDHGDLLTGIDDLQAAVEEYPEGGWAV